MVSMVNCSRGVLLASSPAQHMKSVGIEIIATIATLILNNVWRQPLIYCLHLILGLKYQTERLALFDEICFGT